nr:immunoglobulin light chain junction region [Macaca mulatta]
DYSCSSYTGTISDLF